MFLEKYIITIRAIIDDLSSYREQENYDVANSDITKILGGRTEKELAIFRNCLFALKNYKFQTETWDTFSKQYLPGYNGIFTNAEVMNMFTDDEKWILDLNEEPRSKLLGIFVGEEIYCTGRVHTPIRKSAYNIFNGGKFSGASSGVCTRPSNQW
jgi:hypothetical protein